VSDLTAFSESYREARGKFLDAARTVGARVTSYPHPAGGELHLDVAVLGAADAPHILVVGSGTHGVEGFAGSAAQTAWLREARQPPSGAALVLFHAHNPWGFEQRTRVTEENVDLNRNFVDFRAPPPINAGYAEVHPHITPETWDEASVASVFRWLDAYRERVGEKAFSTAFNGGQYSHADGIFYGGTRAQWANTAFRRAVRDQAGGARRTALVDLHTGIGPYGEHVFVGFQVPGSPAWERCRAWWGERAVNGQGITHAALADYTGVLSEAFAAELPHAETTTTVVEFGTRPRREMQRASMAQRWLRVHGARDPRRAAQVQAEYVEAFYPADARWRQAVLERGREVIAAGLAGIGAG
jgi:hypothetical protein